MKKNKHAKPVSFWTSRLALLLLLLVFAVAYLLVGTFAKYTSSAGGSDSARVARFAVSAAFTGQENSYTVYCTEFPDKTDVTYSPIALYNWQVINGEKYVAETSQKVDVTVACAEALHEIYGLEFRLIYQDENDQQVEVEYQGEPVLDENGRFVYTFPSVATFPVQKDAEGNLIEQSKACDLLIYLTSDSVQPVNATIFVGAVGIQLD